MSGTDELDTHLRAGRGGRRQTGLHRRPRAARPRSAPAACSSCWSRDADPIELTEIHRFTHAWERAASTRLRAGDPDVLAVYHAHGRIRGGTEQEMTADAVRGYLADVLAGHRSLLIVRDNATAAELSARIRAELVAAGRVDATVLGETSDRNPIGRGDWIQARRNDPDLRVDGPGMVTNREVYQVVGRNRRTGFADRARPQRGARRTCPTGYVRAAHHAGLRGHRVRRPRRHRRHRPPPGRPRRRPAPGCTRRPPAAATPTPCTWCAGTTPTTTTRSGSTAPRWPC